MTDQLRATFMGYRLAASSEFWKLLPAAIAEISHGCGPGSGWKEDLIPDSILGVSILPACIVHDCEYFLGMTAQDKELADINFLENMLHIVAAESRFFAMKWIRRRIVFDYYSAVVDGGAEAFWEGKPKTC